METKIRTWLEEFSWTGLYGSSTSLKEYLQKEATPENINEHYFDEILWGVSMREQNFFSGSTRSIPLRELFPKIPPELAFSSLSEEILPRKAKNKLLHSGLYKWSDIFNLTWEDLSQLRYVGIRIQLLFARAFVLLSLDPIEITTYSQGIVKINSEANSDLMQRDISGPFRLDFRSAEQGIYISLLNSTFLKARAWGLDEVSMSELLQSKEFTAALDPRLIEMTSKLWLKGLIIPTQEEIMEAFLDTLDENLRFVLKNRFSPNSEITLDQIGQELGLSRERVRQIEGKLTKQFEKFCEANPLAGTYLEAFLGQVRNLISEKRLLRQNPDYASKLSLKGIRLIDALCAVSGAYKITGGWLLEESQREFDKKIKSLMKELGKRTEPATIAEFIGFLQQEWPQLDEHEAKMILARAGWITFRTFILPKGAGIEEYAYIVLSEKAKPLTIEAIHDELRKGSIGSLRNAMASDTRFSRVSLDEYALVDWGHEVYSNISDMLLQYIEKNGSTPLSRLELEFTQKFKVSEKSVRVYASTYPLVLIEGIVSKTNVRPVVRKSLDKVKNVYSDGEKILLRLVLNDEHLRGSGVPISPALSSSLGVESGKSKQFTHTGGKLRLSWPRLSPHLSSIRSICNELGLNDGDQLMLEFDLEGKVTYWPIELRATNPEKRALELVGYRHSFSGDIFDVIRARVSGPEDVSIEDLLEFIRVSRKEQDLFDLVSQIPK